MSDPDNVGYTASDMWIRGALAVEKDYRDACLLLDQLLSALADAQRVLNYYSNEFGQCFNKLLRATLEGAGPNR